MQSRWLGRLLATLALLAVMAGALWHFLSPGTRRPVEAPPQISKSDFKYHHSPPVISSSAKETDPERDLAGQPKSLRSSGLRLPGNIPVTGESEPGFSRRVFLRDPIAAAGCRATIRSWGWMPAPTEPNRPPLITTYDQLAEPDAAHNRQPVGDILAAGRKMMAPCALRWGGALMKVGWPTGFEPATTSSTSLDSTIELRPPTG